MALICINYILYSGGNCTDLTKNFTCACPPGFSGATCQTELHNCSVIGCTACDGAPCSHGNCNCTCTPNEMYYNCTCDEGYVGVNCDQDINECMNGSVPPKICGDNGTCHNTNGSFRCEVSFFTPLNRSVETLINTTVHGKFSIFYHVIHYLLT